MNRPAFLEAYRAALVALYPWASTPWRLARFMRSVVETLDGANSWHHKSDAAKAAWRAIGGRGVPTLKALRALSVEEA